MRDVMVNNEQRSWVGNNRNMQAWFWIAVPRIAVIQPLGQHTRAPNRKSLGKLLMHMFKVGTRELRVKFRKVDLWN